MNRFAQRTARACGIAALLLALAAATLAYAPAAFADFSGRTASASGLSLSGSAGPLSLQPLQTRSAQASGIVADYSWFESALDANGNLTTNTFVLTDEGSGRNIANKLVGLADIVNGTGDYARKFFDFAGCTITLSGTNVDFLGAEWAPIGTESRAFEGTFDGNNLTIGGFKITGTFKDAGFFGVAGEGSSIKNLSIDNGSSGQGGIRIILPTYYSATEAQEEEQRAQTAGETPAFVEGDVKADGLVANVGTLVGRSYGAVSNCASSMNVAIVNNTEVTDDLPVICDAVGGLVGLSSGALNGCGYEGVMDLYSESATSSTRDQGYLIMTCIAGVVGFFGDREDYTDNMASTVDFCWNKGTVKVNTAGLASDDRFGVDVVAQAGYVGGVVGYTTRSVRNCHNEGTLDTSFRLKSSIPTNGGVGRTTVSAAGSYMGGVVGGVRADVFPGMTPLVPGAYDAGTGCEEFPIEVTHCYNTGTVFGNHAVGGVVGTTGWYATVTNCYNNVPRSNVQVPRRANFDTDAEYYEAYSDYMVAVDGIKGARWNKPMVGGVVGKSYGNISYCYNRSRVWSTTDAGYYVAGIVGVMFRGTSIEGDVAPLPETWACYNTGYAQSSLRAASIAGQNEGIIHDCYAIPETAYHTSDGKELLVHSQYATLMRSDYLEVAQLKSSEGVAKLNFMAESEGWTSSFVLPSAGTNDGYPVFAWQASGVSRSDLSDPAAALSATLARDADYTGAPAIPQLSVTYNGMTLYQNADFRVVVEASAVESTLEVDRTTGTRPYRARIEGIGAYEGAPSLSVEYGIVKGDLSQCTLAVGESKYTGQPASLTDADVVLYTPAGTVVPHSTYAYVVNNGQDCIKRGTYEVEATAIEAEGANFVGSLKQRAFTISPADLKDDVDVARISASGITYTGSQIASVMAFPYTGDEVHPQVGEITYNGMTLVQGTSPSDIPNDYYVHDLDPGADFVNASEETLQFAVEAISSDGVGNYHNYVIYEYWIVPASIGQASIVVPNQAYTSSPRGLVRVSYNGRELKEGTDYTVEYVDNVDVGTASATITGKGNFEGTVVREYQITDDAPLSIEGANIAPIDDQSWTGKPVEPALSVTMDGHALEAGVDYVARFADNVDAGVATVTVEGCGAYSGTASATFAILKYAFTIGKEWGKLASSNPIIKIDGATLTRNRSADVSFDHGFGDLVQMEVQRSGVNAALGYNIVGLKLQTASGADVAVDVERIWSSSESKGADCLAASFVMPKEDVVAVDVLYVQPELSLADCTVDAIPGQVWTGDYITPVPELTAADGTQLVQGVDFVVLQYTNNVDVGTRSAKVLLVGAGNYGGSVECAFSILSASEANAWADDVEAVYDGNGHGILPQSELVNPAFSYAVETEAGLEAEDLSYTLSKSPAPVEVGTYTIYFQAKGTGQLAFGSATVTILPKDAVVRAIDTWKGFEGRDPVLKARVEGVLPADEGSIAYSIAREEGEDPGTYALTPAGDAYQGNYYVTYETGTFTIRSEQAVNVSAEDVDVVYDGAAHGVSPQATTEGARITFAEETEAGLDAEELDYTLEESPVFTDVLKEGGRPKARTVYFKAQVEGDQGEGYAPGYGFATITIKPRPVTVKADDWTMRYGESLPVSAQLAGRVEGLAEGDSADVSVALLLDQDAPAPGTYEGVLRAEVAGAQSSNYTYSYEYGDLVVLPADTTALQKAIADALAAEQGVKTSADGTDVAQSAMWTTSAEKKALDNAIAAAQKKLSGATQGDVDAAAAALRNAIATYNKAKKAGTKTESPATGGGSSAESGGTNPAPAITTAVSVANATVTGIADQTYTGKAFTPAPKVVVNGKTLVSGTDYTLSYKNNVAVGTATVVITGKGGYTGTKEVAFKIKADPATQKAADGTALGSGASAEAADAAITSSASEEGPAGSTFAVLQFRSTKQANKSVTLKWAKPKGAVKYVLYGNACGKKNKMAKVATLKKATYTVKKINKKALKKGTYYKFLLVALDKNNNVVSSSKVIHVATRGGKVTNYSKVTTKAKGGKLSLKAGKTFKLGAAQVKASKKLAVKKHRALKYESTNTKVASVSAKGVVKAKKKGTCYIYAYTQSGTYAKVKVTVK